MTVHLKTPLHPKTKHLDRLTALVQQTLERWLPKSSERPPVVHEAMRYSVLAGGKRFRPLLCLGGCEAAGAPARQALGVACAVELIHTYSLVHDDLPAMDNADERRGQPACHRKFGEGNAILVGDALLTLAFEWLSRNGTTHAPAIIQTITRACGTMGLIGGQVLDLQMISQPRSSTEQALVDVAQRKTAALITASVVAGALAGGGDAKQVRLASQYGQKVGLAFQLIDDVHDQDGLAQAMGIDAARTRAQRLLTSAIDGLRPFGRRGDTLRQLAAWLGTTV